MSNRFDFVKYDTQALEKSEKGKMIAMELEKFINLNLPQGRSSSVALTKLEECFMWIGKAIRDELITKSGKAVNG